MGCGNTQNQQSSEKSNSPPVDPIEQQAQQQAQGYHQQALSFYQPPTTFREASNLMTWYHSAPDRNLDNIHREGLGGPSQATASGSIATRDDKKGGQPNIRKLAEKKFAQGGVFLGKGIESNELYRASMDKQDDHWSQMEVLLTPDQVKSMTTDPTSSEHLHAGVFRGTISPEQINPTQEKRAEIAQQWSKEVQYAQHTTPPAKSADPRAKHIQDMVVSHDETIVHPISKTPLYTRDAVRGIKSVPTFYV